MIENGVMDMPSNPIRKFLRPRKKPQAAPVEDVVAIETCIDEDGRMMMRLEREQSSYRARTGSYAARPVISPPESIVDAKCPAVARRHAQAGWFRPTEAFQKAYEEHRRTRRVVGDGLTKEELRDFKRQTKNEQLLTYAFSYVSTANVFEILGYKKPPFIEKYGGLGIALGRGEDLNRRFFSEETFADPGRVTMGLAIMGTGPDGGVTLGFPSDESAARLPEGRAMLSYQDAMTAAAERGMGSATPEEVAAIRDELEGKREAEKEAFECYGRKGRQGVSLEQNIRSELHDGALYDRYSPEDAREEALFVIAEQLDLHQRDVLRCGWQGADLRQQGVDIDTWRQYYGLPPRESGLFPAFDIRTIPGLPDAPVPRGAMFDIIAGPMGCLGMEQAVPKDVYDRLYGPAAVEETKGPQAPARRPRGRDVSDLPDIGTGGRGMDCPEY